MREGMRIIYICVFPKTDAQMAWYARGYARYIYIGLGTLLSLLASRHMLLSVSYHGSEYRTISGSDLL